MCAQGNTCSLEGGCAYAGGLEGPETLDAPSLTLFSAYMVRLQLRLSMPAELYAHSSFRHIFWLSNHNPTNKEENSHPSEEMRQKVDVASSLEARQTYDETWKNLRLSATDAAQY